MGFAAPRFELFIAAIQDVMDANGMRDARLRVTVTSGDGPLGSDRGHDTPTMTVVASVLKPWPPTETAVTVPWTRNERGALAGIKSTSYGENARALADAKSRGAGEAILANTRGELCEGTGTNLFIVHHNIVKTPPLESGCLAGVTRALVIEACQHAGISIREETMPLSILERCQEAFLTSSTRDVHPLASIDGHRLPGESAAMTQRVAQAFREFIAGKDDP
jgi:branched-chain amino acid aminotransferase